MKEYYFFSNENKRLGYGDNRIIKLGRTHKVKCEPILCEQGLHASARPLDALQYANSAIIWKVTLGGKVIHGDDKSCATERTYIKGGIDISETLRKFARMCALDVVHLWDAPDVVVEYLKTGDEDLRASAWGAAAAATSVRVPAMTLAWDSAMTSTWEATSAVAMARDSAWASARALARKQNRRLAQMISKAIKEV
jgi:hypothetical protein